MMHQDSLEPAAIRFTLKCLQESVRQSGYFFLQLIQLNHWYLSSYCIDMLITCYGPRLF